MKKSFHKFFLLILFLSASQLLRAQSTNAEKKSEPNNSAQTNSIGLKKQSPDPSAINSNNENQIQKDENSVPQLIQSNNVVHVSETIQFDINQMSSDVQSKINNNKSAGKNLMDGIAKGFTVEIKSCINSDETKKILSFLENENGIIKSEFVSKGIIKIIVEPAFDSVVLKEKMLEAGINFNFQNEFYIVIN